MDQNPIISVIIPYYNGAEYFKPCLESVINALDGISSEILLINDASEDMSAKIAESYEEKYENIFNHTIEHSGVSAARNYGVSLAKGKYLSFVDSDDKVLESYYRDMLFMAEKNNTPVTICNVTRENHKGVGVVSAQYQFVFSGEGEPRTLTSIAENNKLVYDAACWNKLIRRDFWLENGMCFPEGRIYEDLPAILKLHLAADRVSILHSFEYRWVIRNKGTKSITQSLDSEQSLTNRVLAARDCLELSKENPDLYLEMQRRVVKWDFEPYIQVFHEMTIEEKNRLINEAADVFREYVTPDALNGMQQYHIQKYNYIMNGDIEGLERIANHKRIAWGNAHIEKRGEDYAVKLPEEIYGMKYVSAKTELQDHIPTTMLVGVKKNGNLLTFETIIYHPRVDMDYEGALEAEAYLYNEFTGAKILLPTKIIQSKEWAQTRGRIFSQDDYIHYNYNYDWCGTECIIDFNRLLDEDPGSVQMLDSEDSPNPRWILFYRYKTPVSEGHRPLRGIDTECKRFILENKERPLEHNGKKYSVIVKNDIRQTIYFEVEMDKKAEEIDLEAEVTL